MKFECRLCITRSPETLMTTDRVVGHAWSSAGTYSVNVTAVSCLGCATKVVPVNDKVMVVKVHVKVSVKIAMIRVKITVFKVKVKMVEVKVVPVKVKVIVVKVNVKVSVKITTVKV